MKNQKTTFFFVFVLFVFAGCAKPGCIDNDAVNFDAEAKNDDMSCTYNGSVTFWMEKIVSDSLVAWGNPMVFFEIDGEIIDSIVTNSFFSTTGACNGGGTKTIQRDFAGNSSRTFSYRILGTGYVPLISDYVQINANDCTVDQLPMPQ